MAHVFYPKKKKIDGKMYSRVVTYPNSEGLAATYAVTRMLRSKGQSARVVRKPGSSRHAVYVREKIGTLCSMCGKSIQRGKGERHRGLSFHKACW